MSKLAKVINVEGSKNIAEVLERSHTNWDIQVMPMAAIGKDGATYMDGGFKALVRPDSGTILGSCSGRYRANNHRSQLSSLEDFIQAGDLIPVNVSMWDNGALLAFQFRAPNLDARIGGKDLVSPLLTLAFAYGFRIADSAFFSDFRWFCKNQMGKVAELNGESRVRHRGDVTGLYGLIMGKRLSELSGELADRYKLMNRMREVKLQHRALAEYVGNAIDATKEEIDMAWVSDDKLKGKAGKIPEILECYEVDDCDAKGTVWQAYNAVTRYQTHHAGHNEATRQRAMLFGTGGETAGRAWKLAAKLVT